MGNRDWPIKISLNHSFCMLSNFYASLRIIIHRFCDMQQDDVSFFHFQSLKQFSTNVLLMAQTEVSTPIVFLYFFLLLVLPIHFGWLQSVLAVILRGEAFFGQRQHFSSILSTVSLVWISNFTPFLVLSDQRTSFCWNWNTSLHSKC